MAFGVILFYWKGGVIRLEWINAEPMNNELNGSDMKKTYITLLRGINVSGHKTILMDDLKDLFEKMDFEEVKTYIQSGNIVFKTRE